MKSFIRSRRRFRSRWPWGRGRGAGEGVDAAVCRCCRVANKIGEFCKKFGNDSHDAVSRIEESVVWGLSLIHI